MAIREILTVGHPILRKKAKLVTEIDDRLITLLDDMIETMRASDGVGLAANQVGVLRRVVVIEVEDELFELINPEIVSMEGMQEEVEGCLSNPGFAGYVQRPEKVVVRAYDRTGSLYEYAGEGLIARAFCHEIDHLDGILFIDKVTKEASLDEE
ncbi:MAG: peptide deformylase [Clostridiales bacterium]|nr:peptide deformylase [Clostridiales bacterium]